MFRIADLIRRTWTAARRPHTVKHAHPPGHRFRPGLEALDGRVLPAANVWLGTDGLLSPSSWSLGHVPTPDEDVVCDGTAGPMSNTSITMPGSLSLTFNSLSLVNGYSGAVTGAGGGALTLGSLTVDTGSVVANGSISAGTVSVTGGAVTLNSSFAVTTLAVSGGALTANTGFTVGQATVSGGAAAINAGMAAGTLSVSGGVVDQGPGSDITVTSGLGWTGGTLNSTANLANLIISGATALIAPAGEGTVSTGDNINFVNGATGTLNPGTVNFTNAGALNISDTSGVTAKPVTINSSVKYVGVSQINLAGTNAYFEVGGPGTFDGTGVPLYNSGGRVWLHDGATVKLGGSVNIGGTAYVTSYYQDGSTANTDIQSGSNLSVEKQAFINGGLLKTSWNPNLADNVTAQTGTLTGDLYVAGGSVQICRGGEAKHYGTFYVTGKVDMEGGTYNPGINGSTNGTNDHWESQGNFLIDQLPNNQGTATLTPVDSAGINTVANGVWQIIKSRGGTITGSFATANLQYYAGPPAKSFTYNAQGVPVTAIALTT